MGLSIIKASPASAEQWDGFWEQCGYATYFHSREWAEIWNVYSGGSILPQPLLINFSDGKEALLPLSQSTSCKGAVRNLLLSPGGTFGGWLSKESLEKEHAELLFKLVCRKGDAVSWHLNPYDPLSGVVSPVIGEVDETHALNLSPGLDAIFNTWTKGHKSATTKARREGVTVCRAVSVEDWQGYFSVYEDSLKRWGDTASSRYGWKLFDEIRRRNSPNATLWLAKFEEVIIAGALCFYASNHVVYWHGAALADYFHLRPVNLLVYESVRDACDRRFSWFDFNPSGGHEGVKAFKRSFCAESIPFRRITMLKRRAAFLKKLSSLYKRGIS